jgi:hypothetical protein
MEPKATPGRYNDRKPKEQRRASCGFFARSVTPSHHVQPAPSSAQTTTRTFKASLVQTVTIKLTTTAIRYRENHGKDQRRGPCRLLPQGARRLLPFKLPSSTHHMEPLPGLLTNHQTCHFYSSFNYHHQASLTSTFMFSLFLSFSIIPRLKWVLSDHSNPYGCPTSAIPPDFPQKPL